MTVTILQGDALAQLRALPDGAFQTCVTSPPYYGLRDYGAEGQIGLEESPEAYVARLVDVFREVRRTLRDDGTLWLNIGDSYAATGGPQVRQTKWQVDGASAGQNGGEARRPPDGAKPKDLLGIPWMVAFALRADGWYLRKDIIWHKPNPMPESVTDRPTSAHEYVFLFAKQPRYFYDAAAIREAESVPDWDNGTRVFGGKNKHGANAGHARTTGRLAEKRDRGLPPRHAQYDSSDQSGLDKAPRGEGRNARDVWTIATRPYAGAHFATMPPDLAERCIKAGTSAGGACPHCGAPWDRTMERRAPVALEVATGGDPARQDSGTRERDPGGAGGTRLARKRVHGERFLPQCDCPEHEPAPCRVLDPFGGAGTTGLVADRLLRAATLIELNPQYADLARQRITGDAPLLHSPAAE